MSSADRGSLVSARRTALRLSAVALAAAQWCALAPATAQTGAFPSVFSQGVGPVDFAANARVARIVVELDRNGVVEIRVFNLLGEEMWNRSIQGKAGVNKVPFDGQSLSEGVYIYKLASGQKTQTGRMVIHR